MYPIASTSPQQIGTGGGPRPLRTVRVAVVIPILNEAATLAATLFGLEAQDYPRNLHEILVIDGGSEDIWRPIVESFRERGMPIRILSNPKRTVPAAVNLALRSTDAEAILWISGHCVLSPNYLSSTVGELAVSGPVVVGGRLEIVGRGFRGRLNAMILSSRFGTGWAAFRAGRDPGDSATVTFALFPRRTLLDIRGLDERLERNQDNDLLNRLRRAGVRCRRVDAVARYLAPLQFHGLWRRSWANGVWNIRTVRLGKRGLSWWHFAPMAMVGIAALLLIAWPFGTAARTILPVLAGAYVILALGSSIATTVKNRTLWALPILPVLFFIHHAIYGLGSWAALLTPVPRADIDSHPS